MRFGLLRPLLVVVAVACSRPGDAPAQLDASSAPFAGSKDAAVLTKRNSMTAPYLWVLCSLSVIPSLLWWDSTPVLTAFLLVFVVSYVLLYGSIVRFRTPDWLIVRR